MFFIGQLSRLQLQRALQFFFGPFSNIRSERRPGVMIFISCDDFYFMCGLCFSWWSLIGQWEVLKKSFVCDFYFMWWLFFVSFCDFYFMWWFLLHLFFEHLFETFLVHFEAKQACYRSSKNHKKNLKKVTSMGFEFAILGLNRPVRSSQKNTKKSQKSDFHEIRTHKQSEYSAYQAGASARNASLTNPWKLLTEFNRI